MWCVGLWLADSHKLCVFDTEAEAVEFFQTIDRAGVYLGADVSAVYRWEL